MTQTSTLLWTQPDWIDQAHAWINAAVAQTGSTLTGPIEQLHARIWSTVMRVPTSSGLLYFKACVPDTEPRLTVALRRVLPEHIPDVLAADLDQGWMLLRDAGPMLRTYLKTPADLEKLEPALALYAGLQIAVVDQAEQFLAMGALDRRLERLPDLFEAMMEDTAILRIGEADGLDEVQYRRLLELRPRYRAMCQELAGYAIPHSLHHDDFHDGNIFVSGSDSAHYRLVFSDWGESCVTHPFFSMIICLRSVGSRVGLPDEATETPEGLPPELSRLRDRYLQPWLQYERAEHLIPIFNLAWRVGMVNRAMTWREFVNSIPASQHGDFTHIVPAWLGEFLLTMD